VNFRLINFFVFDLRRSLSPDLHESCDFKLKNRSLEKPISRKKPNTAFFSLFDENWSNSLILAKKSTEIYQKKWGITALLMENGLILCNPREKT